MLHFKHRMNFAPRRSIITNLARGRSIFQNKCKFCCFIDLNYRPHLFKFNNSKDLSGKFVFNKRFIHPIILKSIKENNYTEDLEITNKLWKNFGNYLWFPKRVSLSLEKFIIVEIYIQTMCSSYQPLRP